MTNYETLQALISALDPDDAIIRTDTEDRTIRITFDDFEGFDDEWAEIDRPYNNYEAVDDLIEWVCDNAIVEGYMWNTYYRIDEWTVTIHYTSEDI